MNSLAPIVDQAELLQLAQDFVLSRHKLFTVESVFTARIRRSGVFIDGLRCRAVLSPPGILRVFVESTGELLAESQPGQPLVPSGRLRRNEQGEGHE